MVLVDTPVWSLALRRQQHKLSLGETMLTQTLRELIREGRAQLIGVIRQEVLSGIRVPEKFRSIRDYFRAFDDPELEIQDYERAAEMTNQCRARGIAGSAIDFLLCAVAHGRGWQILTTDSDFTHFQKVMPIRLFSLADSP